MSDFIASHDKALTHVVFVVLVVVVGDCVDKYGAVWVFDLSLS